MEGKGCHDDMRRVKHALMHMLKAKLASALETWRANAPQAAGVKSKIRGTLKKMLERNLSLAFEKWLAVAPKMKQELYGIKNAAMHMLKAKLSSAFMAWRELAGASANAKHHWNDGCTGF